MTSDRRPRVLVVDDEPDVRQYLRAVLEDAEFEVWTAQDGNEAMQVVREQRPDLISLDVLMPRKSGHKLLFELKGDDELAQIRVLIVTAHARELIVGALGAGDLGDSGPAGPATSPSYLEKPVDPATYVRAVWRALGIQERQEVLDRIEPKQELQDRLRTASSQSLRDALDALRKP